MKQTASSKNEKTLSIITKENLVTISVPLSSNQSLTTLTS